MTKQTGENEVSEKIIRLPKVKEMVGLGTTAIYDKTAGLAGVDWRNKHDRMAC